MVDRPRSVALTVMALEVAPDPVGSMSLACLACDGPVELHQPDSDAPDRLLATCPACGAWHEILGAAIGRVLLLLLPSEAIVRRALSPTDDGDGHL